MHTFTLQDAADVFSAVTEAFQFTDNAVKHFDFICFLFADRFVGNIVQECRDMIFHPVRNFLQLYQIHSVFLEFVRIFFIYSEFHIVETIMQHRCEMCDFLECLRDGYCRCSEMTCRNINKSGLVFAVFPGCLDEQIDEFLNRSGKPC